jgi:tetratricopeptide (TPR) repeat protein
MIDLRSLAAIALCAIAVPVHAGEELQFGEPPQWVVNFNPAEAPALDADMPAHVRLSDFQTRLEAGKTEHYIGLEIEIRNPEGLSAGNLSLSWRPEFDEVTVHHVLIERGDTVTNVLADGQTFTIMRREQNLEEAVLTGILTANMFPNGLEVGDILKFAYTVSEANPVLAGHAESAFGPLNGIVGQTHFRLTWPEDVSLRVAASDDLPALKRASRGGYESMAMEMELREPALPPAAAPPRYQLVRMVEATTFDSWGELAQLFVPLYQEASRIPPDGPLRAALEEIRGASEDPMVRTEMALALVQNRIRYVALAMGVGGLVPADTATTWARRFGDCKAKTALLLGLLRELGIDAEPVLVNSTLGDALPQRLPMVSAFDHVLVRAHVAGRDYFLDGTRRGDTSLARILTPHFVWGLPVADTGSVFVPMVAPALALPDEETNVRMDASGGLRAPAPTQIETILRGDKAIAINAAMAQYVGQTRRQVLEQYWRERFDYVTPESIDFRFDQASGEVRITLAGTAAMDWDYNSFEPSGMRVGYTPDFTRAPGPESDAPFAVPHPFFNRTKFEVTLPDGFTQGELDGENVDQIVAGVEYRRELGLADNLFTATRSTRSVAQEFPASEATAAKQALERLWDQRVFLKIPERYRLSRAEVDAMARAESENPQALIDQGVALMDQGEWLAARNVFDKVIEIEPRNQWGWANRAVANAHLGNGEVAESDAAKALEIAPNNYVSHHARGLLAMAKRDFAGAVEAFSLAVDLHDGNSFALRQRAMAYANLDNFEEAIADANELVAMEPELPANYVFRGMILGELGREDELAAHVEDMLARFPGDQALRAAASEMFMQAGADDKADALLAESLGGDPNVIALMTSASRRPVGETDAKLAELDEVLRIEPDLVPALLMRANTLWMEYRFQPALSDVNRALDLSPGLAQAYSIKVKVLLDMNRRTEALRTVDEMTERSARDPMALAMAAQHYQQLGRAVKARETLARAREIAPDNQFVESVASHIR